MTERHVYAQDPNAPERKAVTVPALRAMKQEKNRITMLTAYDASFAAKLEAGRKSVV